MTISHRIASASQRLAVANLAAAYRSRF